MVFSTSTKHKTRTSMKSKSFSQNGAHITKNGKFIVFNLQCTKVGENYGRNMMHGVMKA